jgi:putative hemolysin
MKYTVYCLGLAFLASLIYLQSCTYDKGEVPKPVKAVSYQNDIKPIIQTYCYGQGGQTCHVTPSNQGAVGDFTTYAGLKAKADNGTIQIRVFNLKDMPPAYSSGPTALTAEALETFKSWVNNGAPKN